MKRKMHVAVMATLAVALVVRAVAGEITDRDVRQAIERGVEYLKDPAGQDRGSWLEHPCATRAVSRQFVLWRCSKAGWNPTTRPWRKPWTTCALRQTRHG